MVEITDSTEPSETISKKAKRTWIRKLSNFSYCVTPRGPWGTKRRVTLFLSGNRLKVVCEHYYTGEECPACRFGNLCYSVTRVIGHVENKLRRQKRQEAA